MTGVFPQSPFVDSGRQYVVKLHRVQYHYILASMVTKSVCQNGFFNQKDSLNFAQEKGKRQEFCYCVI